MRVPCDVQTELRRLIHHGLDLVEIELRNVELVAIRKHAAGCHDLDEVHAALDVLAHTFAKTVGA